MQDLVDITKVIGPSIESALVTMRRVSVRYGLRARIYRVGNCVAYPSNLQTGPHGVRGIPNVATALVYAAFRFMSAISGGPPGFRYQFRFRHPSSSWSEQRKEYNP